jgi:hypothetical protein
MSLVTNKRGPLADGPHAPQVALSSKADRRYAIWRWSGRL